MSRAGKGRSTSRVVTYTYEIPGPYDSFDECPIESILSAAQEKGIVTNFDTGRGRVCWFQGAPGVALRELCNKIAELLGPQSRRIIR